MQIICLSIVWAGETETYAFAPQCSCLFAGNLGMIIFAAIKQWTMKKIFLLLLLVTPLVIFVGCKKENPQQVENEWDNPSKPTGLLPGKFTINADGKQVNFFKGNLYFDGSNFCFEKNQYEFKDSWDANHVSYFYWHRDAAIASSLSYDINQDYWKTVSDVFFTGEGFPVIGEVSEFNTSVQEIEYETLSADEWAFLINDRSASTIGDKDNARFTKARIEVSDNTYVNGLILFPDNFDVPEGVTVPSGINAQDVSFNSNTYSLEDWSKLEPAGVVFLPVAGYRDKSKVRAVGVEGFYWSSSPNEERDDCACFVHVYSDVVKLINTSPRCFGYCVRLVKEVK